MSQQQHSEQSVPWQYHATPDYQNNPEASSTANDSGETTGYDLSQITWPKKGNKISLKEKRRRQNKTLRRLITPKNALMVLNELSGGSQQECTVTPEGDNFTSNNVNRQYVAVLNMGGVKYSGKGSTKLMAKNMAAENVIRDMILKQMSVVPSEKIDKPVSISPMSEVDDESFPMIQLASYALHKLFSEWQTEGYKVPLFGATTKEQTSPVQTNEVVPPPGKPKKTPVLPGSPELMHPCMLLSQMCGTLEYTLVSQEGAPPNRLIFTIGVTIDGKAFAGQGTNKKEARKQAAKKACAELYGVVYPDEAMVVENQI